MILPHDLKWHGCIPPITTHSKNTWPSPCTVDILDLPTVIFCFLIFIDQPLLRNGRGSLVWQNFEKNFSQAANKVSQQRKARPKGLASLGRSGAFPPCSDFMHFLLRETESKCCNWALDELRNMSFKYYFLLQSSQSRSLHLSLDVYKFQQPEQAAKSC